MKVIILKDCKDGKADQVIDVSAGYATNFLIKNQFGVPFNKKTEAELKRRLQIKAQNHAELHQNALKVQEKLEQITLHFSLKVTNLVVHGSITRKQILKELKDLGIHLDVHSVENSKIDSTGITNLNIYLFEGVVAKLKIEVKPDVN